MPYVTILDWDNKFICKVKAKESETIHSIKRKIRKYYKRDIILFGSGNEILECESKLSSCINTSNKNNIKFTSIPKLRGGLITEVVYAQLLPELGNDRFYTLSERRRCCSLVPDPKLIRTFIPPPSEFVFVIKTSNLPYHIFSKSDFELCSTIDKSHGLHTYKLINRIFYLLFDKNLIQYINDYLGIEIIDCIVRSKIFNNNMKIILTPKLYAFGRYLLPGIYHFGAYRDDIYYYFEVA